MRAYQVTQLSDAVLDSKLTEIIVRERGTTAEMLVLIAEFDTRRLQVPAGYSSMFAYCVEKLRLSEDATYRRIRASRAARQFPALLTMLTDGRLHLAAISLLAPHLTPQNADELMAAATHRKKSEIEQLIARRFPDRKLPVILRPIPGDADFARSELVPGRVEVPERYELKLTISKATREKLQHAQELLSHCVPSGEVAQVLDRALDALIAQLEKRKFAASSNPRTGHRPIKSNRCIPAQVRRAVWQRDQGQCTFVSDDGHRCDSRKFLEFDHIEPVARGGEATVKGLRLRCRAHNQYEAEQVFGAGFMHEKRSGARGAVAMSSP